MGGVVQHPGGHHPVGVGLELQQKEQVQPPRVRLVAPRLHLHAPDHVADALAQVRADVLGGQAFEGVEPQRPEHAVGVEGVGDKQAQEVADHAPMAEGRLVGPVVEHGASVAGRTGAVRRLRAERA